jgi:hypothetical protein
MTLIILFRFIALSLVSRAYCVLATFGGFVKKDKMRSSPVTKFSTRIILIFSFLKSFRQEAGFDFAEKGNRVDIARGSKIPMTLSFLKT